MSAFTTPRAQNCSFSEGGDYGLPNSPPPLRPKVLKFHQEEAPRMQVSCDCEDQLRNNTLPGFFLVPPSDFFEGLEFPSESSNFVLNRGGLPCFRPNKKSDSRHYSKVYKLKPRPFSIPPDECRQPFGSVSLAPRPSSFRPPFSATLPLPEKKPSVPQSNVSKVNLEPNINLRRVSVDDVANEA
ncbi:hypothetical protein ACHAXS_005058 [Conticribra weissflogii]